MDNACEYAEAFETAVADGVDVINFSIGFDGSGFCNVDYDPCGLDDVLWNAFQAGVVVVTAPGNDTPSNGSCTVEYPSTRSEVVAAGYVDSRQKSASYSTLLRSTQPGCYSPTSNIVVTKFPDFQGASYKPISILVPGFFDRLYTSGTNGYGPSYSSGWHKCGSSYSAPLVAGAIGQVKEWMSSFGWDSANEPGALIANMLVMGDHYNGSTSNAAAEYYYTMGEHSGAGRLRMHYPSSNSLGAENAWRSRFTTIYDGGTVEWSVGSTSAEGSGAGVKAALYWQDYDLELVPELQLRIVDKCASGGQSVVVTASSSDVIRQHVYVSPQSAFGKCLWVQVLGVDVPPGGHPFWAASYKFSNSEAEH